MKLSGDSFGDIIGANGIIFFQGEAKSVKQVRMQIVEKDTGAAQVLILKF